MKQNIALVCGGYSKEYDVSMRSAAQVAEQIDLSKYNVYKIIINRTRWYAVADNGDTLAEVDKNDFSIVVNNEYRVKFDMAFIIVHGTPGEDGLLKGTLICLTSPTIHVTRACPPLHLTRHFAMRFWHTTE